MNSGSDSNGDIGTASEAKSRTISNAVLGIPKSHGMKLPLNMTSQDKRELLTKLEEWRKARREKLAATIQAKQKQHEKPNIWTTASKKIKSCHKTGADDELKAQGKESVFERLYKDSQKNKKSKGDISYYTKKATVREPTVLNGSDKSKLDEAIHNLQLYSGASIIENCDLAKGKVQAQVHKQMKESPGNIEKMEDMLPTKATVLTSISGKPRVPLRRSLSMMFRQKHKPGKILHRTHSEKNLSCIIYCESSFVENKDLVNFAKNKLQTKVHEQLKVNTGNSTDLRTKLEDWLKVNGHPLEGYRHLRCFDIAGNVEPLSAANISLNQTSAVTYDTSLTNNLSVDDSNKENIIPPSVPHQDQMPNVENWLKELHRLIVDLKYPPDRCKEWLAAIKKKSITCTQLSIYWECLAALQESKGDINFAVDDDSMAIYKVDKANSEGDLLTQLFDKMVIEQKKPSKSKLEKGLDPKNIFQSTTVKFALQQKPLKELGSKIDAEGRQQFLIATPVRRSSRIQTPHKSDIVTSLQSLTPEVRRIMKFKLNESLLNAE